MQKWIQIFDINQLKKIDIYNYDFVVLGTETCIFKVKFDDLKWVFLTNKQIEYLKVLLNWKKLVYITSLLPEYVKDKYFAFLKNLIEIIGVNKIEITINDWWIYNWLKQNKYIWKVVLNIWTNFYYHVKDPYAKYYQNKFKRISIDRYFYNDFFRNLWFNWYLEVYYPLQGLEIKYLNFPVSLYYPFVQYTFSRACPWSLVRGWERVSKLILSCWGCPKNYYENIVHQRLKRKQLNLKSFYIPNWQYYNIEDFYSIDDIINAIDIYRVVYNTFLINE